jgi:N-formylmaleamate deformylase
MKALLLGLTIMLSGTLVRANAPISVTRIGQGPPVIFLPCLGCAGDIWRETAEELARTRECVLVSIAGFGSPASPGGFDQGRVREAIADLARKQTRKPALIGHSYGGFLAMQVAAAHPDLFSRIAVVDAYPRAAALLNPAVTQERVEKDAEMIRRLTENLSPDQFAAQQKQILHAGITSEDKIGKILPAILASDRRAIALAQSEMLQADLRARLKSIHAPILVIGTVAGREKFGLTREILEERLREQFLAAPNVSTAISERSRHFVMLDDPAWLSSHLREFLNR